MPPRTGGMRRPTEEKALLAELGKMFHVAKATHKEHHNAQHTSASPAVADKKKKAGRGAAKDTRPGSKRRSAHGGSIWMVLKGGFGPHAVPTAADSKCVAARAQQRAALSERRRVAALQEAEAYIESAWQQARESELVSSDNTPTEEGDAYLAEQYATAARMLAPSPAGAFLHQLVETHSGSAAAAASPAESATFSLSRAEWEDVCTREAAIFFRYRTRATPSASAEEYFREQQNAREQQMHFATAEPMSRTGGDIAPTKCIVRLRDSQRNKFTSLLSTAKAVNYFKSNIGQVLRKELAGSKLARGGAGDEGDSGAAPGGKHGGGNTNNSSNNVGGSAGASNATHSAKKKRKR